MAKEIIYILPLLLVPFLIPEKKQQRTVKPKYKVVDLRPLSERIENFYTKKYKYMQKYYK